MLLIAPSLTYAVTVIEFKSANSTNARPGLTACPLTADVCITLPLIGLVILIGVTFAGAPVVLALGTGVMVAIVCPAVTFCPNETSSAVNCPLAIALMGMILPVS